MLFKLFGESRHAYRNAPMTRQFVSRLISYFFAADTLMFRFTLPLAGWLGFVARNGSETAVGLRRLCRQVIAYISTSHEKLLEVFRRPGLTTEEDRRHQAAQLDLRQRSGSQSLISAWEILPHSVGRALEQQGHISSHRLCPGCHRRSVSVQRLSSASLAPSSRYRASDIQWLSDA